MIADVPRLHDVLNPYDIQLLLALSKELDETSVKPSFQIPPPRFQTRLERELKLVEQRRRGAKETDDNPYKLRD